MNYFMEMMRAILLLACGLMGVAAGADFEYLREGDPADAVTRTRAGYALLGGGGDVEEAFRWMIERSGGGDFLVLRATGTGAYNPYVMKLGGAHSAATLILRNREASSNPEVLDKVRKAEAIFFAGGDQWNYVSRWKGTPIEKAIQERIDAGVPVGGTSAGLAILGEFLFSAEFDTVQTPQAVANPYDKRVAVDCCFLKIPHLGSLITDSHFSARNRMGRLAVFLARLMKDGRTRAPRGLGIDEATAVLVDPQAGGKARVVGKAAAFFVRPTAAPARCEAGQPLTFEKLDVVRMDRTSGEFDLPGWKAPASATRSVLDVAQGEVRWR